MMYLGIDVGGTNIAVGVVNENKEIIAKASNKSPVPCTMDEFCDTMALTAKQAMEKAAPAVNAAEKKMRESSRKIRAAMAPEVYVQACGRELDVAEIQERCRAAYRATHKIGIHSMKVYIKPEESAAYYVINKETGEIEL